MLGSDDSHHFLAQHILHTIARPAIAHGKFFAAHILIQNWEKGLSFVAVVVLFWHTRCDLLKRSDHLTLKNH